MKLKGMTFAGIDFGDLERSMRERQSLKERAMESHQEKEHKPGQEPQLEAHRLINTLQHKGSVLNIAV